MLWITVDLYFWFSKEWNFRSSCSAVFRYFEPATGTSNTLTEDTGIYRVYPMMFFDMQGLWRNYFLMLIKYVISQRYGNCQDNQENGLITGFPDNWLPVKFIWSQQKHSVESTCITSAANSNSKHQHSLLCLLEDIPNYKWYTAACRIYHKAKQAYCITNPQWFIDKFETKCFGLTN